MRSYLWDVVILSIAAAVGLFAGRSLFGSAASQDSQGNLVEQAPSAENKAPAKARTLSTRTFQPEPPASGPATPIRLPPVTDLDRILLEPSNPRASSLMGAIVTWFGRRIREGNCVSPDRIEHTQLQITLRVEATETTALVRGTDEFTINKGAPLPGDVRDCILRQVQGPDTLEAPSDQPFPEAFSGTAAGRMSLGPLED